MDDEGGARVAGEKGCLLTETPVDPWGIFSEAWAGLALPDDFFSRAEEFLEVFSTVNQTVNLMSYGTPEDLRRHFADAVQVLRVPFAGGRACAIDVGTGGGFPGVPIALGRPDWTVVLLDSLKRKQWAVASVLERAPVPNALVLCARAEEKAQEKDHRESYDFAFCRAVGRFSTVLELTLPFVKVGGRVILHRGNDGPQELGVTRRVLEQLGGQPGPVVPYRLPGLDRERFIVCIDKKVPTPALFPRRPGVPEKRPL